MNLRKKMILASIVVCMALLVNLNAGHGDIISDHGTYDGEPDDSFYQDYAVVRNADGSLLLIPNEDIDTMESLPRPTRSSNSPFYKIRDSDEVGRFSTVEELRSYIENHSSHYYYPHKVTEGSAMATALGYSTTNNQVSGVDEGDIVKTDGEYAYMVSKDEDSVFIADVNPPEDAAVVSTVETVGSIQEIYVIGHRLIVIGERDVYQIDPNPDSLENQYCSVRSNGKKVKFNIGRFYYLKYIHYEATFVDIFDIENRGDPRLLDSHVIRGSHLGSRMIGNHIYALTTSYIHCDFQEFDLPVPVSDIHYIKYSDEPTYLGSPLKLTTIFSIDVTKSSTIKDLRAILTPSSTELYVSTNNIYLTYHTYDYYYNNDDKTLIHRISIDDGDILYGSYGEVEGSVINRFSMDEHDGHFRVAVHIRYPSSQSVYVLNMNLEIVGSLENIAPDELIYSARFIADRVYLVTYRRIDPFHVIDLSDPEKPAMLGELVIPGWSDYLHPFDENHIIGLGRETDIYGSLLGIKLSLFDVTDVEDPIEKSKFVLGNRYSSTIATEDPHAFLFDREKNLLVIPVRYNYTVSGAFVFDIGLEYGLEPKGMVSHPRDDESSGYYWYRHDSEIKRSFYIGDSLYTLSNGYLQANDLNDLHEIACIELPCEPLPEGVSSMCIYIEPITGR